MSIVIICDGCNRNTQGTYYEISIDGENRLHLCVHCLDGMMRKIFHMHYDDLEERYVADRSGCE